ncbi:uncharacterized protein MONBRDRAFT_39125 [Monosiga brevicollis MX1]|uniref:Uncharacterized protein n=1 Tax=Monosiga brevicollis TaxID=81824 RepID=A9VCE7_MONBE|nr:uncharacterized protein MONBRDRAFT_39125 [Monosiga brevicollis MX1]EDQ84772.1 predicted protein [Monosiga brevicollis MX1]|eukprot:XP_001750422.1 hypothetical protein [Monosiga brevicollis MX1]
MTARAVQRVECSEHEHERPTQVWRVSIMVVLGNHKGDTDDDAVSVPPASSHAKRAAGPIRGQGSYCCCPRFVKDNCPLFCLRHALVQKPFASCFDTNFGISGLNCTREDSANVCGDHGSCSVSTGLCQCDVGYSGPTCAFPSCHPLEAQRPGLSVQLFSDYNLLTPIAFATWPQIAFEWGYDSPEPAPANNFGVVAAGFLRAHQDGFARFQCRTRNGNCHLFLNGTLVTSTTDPIFLVAGQPLRLKAELQHASYQANWYLDWSGPHPSSAAALSAELVPIPATNLEHRVACPNGCNNLGCCEADQRCVCPDGYTGPNCNLAIDQQNCGDAFPQLPYTPAGLNMAVFSPASGNAPAIANLTNQEAAFSFSAAPAGASSGWSAVLYGQIQIDTTGWYTFQITPSGGRASLVIGPHPVILPATSAESSPRSVFLTGNRRYNIHIGFSSSRTAPTSLQVLWTSPDNATLHAISSDQLLAPTSGTWCGYPDFIDCNHAGINVNGACVCPALYIGASCEHFRCRSDECRFTDACHDPAYGSQDAECNGQGRCVAGLCECYDGFVDLSQCTRTGCATDEGCSGHGSCGSDGQCVCEAGYMGEACELSVCGNERAIVPGLYATYYEGYAFDERRIGLAVPEVAFDLGNGGPSPDVSVDDFSATFVGFVRPTTTGWYRFRLRCTNGACGMYLNQSAYADSGNGLLLVGGESVRVKLEWQHTSYGTTAVFEWQGPYESAAVAQGADESLFVGVPSHALLHEVVCTGGCGGRGCCVAPETCACEPGYTGPQCELAEASCSGSTFDQTLSPGLQFRAFDGILEDAVTSAYPAEVGRAATINFDYGYDSPGPSVPADYFTAVWSGLVKPPQSGWYTFRVWTSGVVARLFVGNVRLIDWTTGWSQAIHLAQDRYYQIRFDIQEETFTAAARLYWEGPGFMEHLVPSSALFSRSDNNMCSCPLNCTWSSQGTCLNGLCSCRRGFTGDTCAELRCRADDCLFHDNCFHPAFGSAYDECGGEGVCINGQCQCDANAATASNVSSSNSGNPSHNASLTTFTDFHCSAAACPGDSTCGAGGTCGAHGCSCSVNASGNACQYASCAHRAGIRAGVRVTYFDDVSMHAPTASGLLATTAAEWDHSPWPSIGADGFAVQLRGLLLFPGAGWYRARCTESQVTCTWQLGDAGSVGPVRLDATTASRWAPFHINVSHTTSVAAFAWEVAGPFDTEAAAANASRFWQPANWQLGHDITCGGCVHGCCQADGVCMCEPGWSGALCNEPLPSCDAIESETVVTGAIVRYYTDRTFSTLVATDRILHLESNFGSEAPYSGVPSDYFGVRYEAFFTPPHDGWYRFDLVTNSMEGLLRVAGQLVLPISSGWSASVYLAGQVPAPLLLEIYKTTQYSCSFQVTVQGENSYSQFLDGTNLLYYPGACGCLPCDLAVVNDHAPVFSSASMAVLVVREHEVGSHRWLEATDPDTGDGFGLQYILVDDPSGCFSLDETTGQLSLLCALSKATHPEGFVLEVAVADSGSPARNVTGLLAVVIECALGFTGDACSSCAAGYGGSTCKPCVPCSARGVCGEGGSCVCVNNTFAGAACDECVDRHYGEDCLPLPWVASLSPPVGLDYGGTRVVLMVHNMPAERSQVVCKFGTLTSTAAVLDDEHVACQTPRQEPASVQVRVSFDGGETFVGPATGLAFTYVGDCPQTDCPPSRAYCVFGECYCRLQYFGDRCAQEYVRPVIRPIPSGTLLPGDRFSQRLELQAGNGEIHWVLMDGPNGAFIDGNTVVWPVATSASEPHEFLVQARNSFAAGVAAWDVEVPFPYTTSILSTGGAGIRGAPVQIVLAGVVSKTHPRVSLGSLNDLGVRIWVQQLSGPAVRRRRRSVSQASVLTAKTNSTGHFSVQLSLSNIGAYSLGVSHPNATSPEDSTVVEVAGLESSLSAVQLSLDSGFNGSLFLARITNPSSVAIDQLHVALAGLYGASIPQGIRLTASVHEESLMAGSFTDLSLHVSSAPTFAGTLVLGVRVTEAKYGVFVPVTVVVTFTPPRAQLEISTTYMAVTAVRNVSTSRVVTLRNVGSTSTPPLVVVLPEGHSLLSTTTATIPSLAANTSLQIGLVFTPQADATLQRDTATVVVRSAATSTFLNSVQVQIDYVVASTATFDVAIVVEDEYTFFAEGAPNVSDAVVRLVGQSRAFSRVLTTGPNGTVIFRNVPEGTYQVSAQALGHDVDSAVIRVNDNLGLTPLFLARKTVSYIWSVSPTQIDDEYSFTLEAVFETRVPVPVVTIDPIFVDVDRLAYGDIEQIDFIITNHGLIAADEPRLSLPSVHPNVQLIPLYEPVNRLPAQTTIIYSYEVIVSDGNASTARMRRADNDDDESDDRVASFADGDNGLYDDDDNTTISNPSDDDDGNGGGGSNDDDGPGGNGGNNGGDNGGDNGGNDGGGGGSGGPGEEDRFICGGRAGLFTYSFQCRGTETRGTTIELRQGRVGSVRPSFCGGARSVARTAGNGGGRVTGVGNTIGGGCGDFCSMGDVVANCMGNTCLGSAAAAALSLKCQNAKDMAKRIPRALIDCLIGGCPGALLNVPFCDANALGIIQCAGNIVLGCTGPYGRLAEAAFAGAICMATIGSTISAGGLRRRRDMTPSFWEVVRRDADEDLAAETAYQAAQWLENYALFLHAVFGAGNDTLAFSYDPSFQATHFMPALAESGDMGALVSESELQSLMTALPADVNASKARAWYEKYNATAAAWIAGSLDIAEESLFNLTEIEHRFEQLRSDSSSARMLGYPDILSAYHGAVESFRVARDAAARKAGVCAKVTIMIEQELVLTRSAFEARLQISNEDAEPLTNISVQFVITHVATGAVALHVFEIGNVSYLGDLQPMAGQGADLPSTGVGTATWLMIPNRLAAPSPSMEEYYVGGMLYYTINGIRVEVELFPDTIVVQPDPRMTVHYFLQEYVVSDDPFTDVKEAAQPATLAVVVHNHGNGTAIGLSVSSQQPQITENEKGLLVGFELQSTSLNGVPVTPPQLEDVDVGSLAPDTSKVVAWEVMTTLQGRFTKFEVDMKYSNVLGKPELALVESVSAYKLLHMAAVSSGFDFVVRSPSISGLFCLIHSWEPRSVIPLANPTGEVEMVFNASSRVGTFASQTLVTGPRLTQVVLPGRFKATRVSRSVDGTRVDLPVSSFWVIHVTDHFQRRRRNDAGVTTSTLYVVDSDNNLSPRVFDYEAQLAPDPVEIASNATSTTSNPTTTSSDGSSVSPSASSTINSMTTLRDGTIQQPDSTLFPNPSSTKAGGAGADQSGGGGGGSSVGIAVGVVIVIVVLVVIVVVYIRHRRASAHTVLEKPQASKHTSYANPTYATAGLDVAEDDDANSSYI